MTVKASSKLWCNECHTCWTEACWLPYQQCPHRDCTGRLLPFKPKRPPRPRQKRDTSLPLFERP